MTICRICKQPIKGRASKSGICGYNAECRRARQRLYERRCTGRTQDWDYGDTSEADAVELAPATNIWGRPLKRKTTDKPALPWVTEYPRSAIGCSHTARLAGGGA